MIHFFCRIFIFLNLSILCWQNSFASIDKTPPLKVVATFSILGDLVKTIGGDAVQIETIVDVNADPHIFEPKPATNLMLSNAAAIFTNGLGLEGWMDRLIRASGYKGHYFVATRGIHSLKDPHDQTQIDPHAWHSLHHIKTYARNIAADLSILRPCHRDLFQQRAETFINNCETLMDWAQQGLKKISVQKRVVVTAHDAFYYLGKDLGILFETPQGITTESEPSAKDMARIIRFIKEKKVRVIFVESLTNKRLIQQLAEEAGVMVGETLYADALSAPDGPAPTYEKLMHHNLTQMFRAMATTAP